MTTQHHQVIAKILIGAAVALGAYVGGAAPASADESPIGSALIGHKKGDIVTIDVPRGPKKKLKITKIEAA